ncbi:hypothetical protein ACFQY8_02175 [Alloscardovia venturai]|uniref:Uncharacterized protein n=1 Tax=Alloscardovia venturai TaxID=1769421 RepID=A0ABW2Y2S2_9BIFI
MNKNVKFHFSALEILNSMIFIKSLYPFPGVHLLAHGDTTIST